MPVLKDTAATVYFHCEDVLIFGSKINMKSGSHRGCAVWYSVSSCPFLFSEIKDREFGGKDLKWSYFSKLTLGFYNNVSFQSFYKVKLHMMAFLWFCFSLLLSCWFVLTSPLQSQMWLCVRLCKVSNWPYTNSTNFLNRPSLWSSCDTHSSRL